MTNRITFWFLNLPSYKLFFVVILGFFMPFYFWMYSIIYQLDKKRDINHSKIFSAFLKFIAVYPTFYFAFFLISIFSNSSYFSDFFEIIMVFHFIATICGLILLILTIRSYYNFEKIYVFNGYSKLVIFFLVMYFIIGMWILQPKLNKYVQNDFQPQSSFL